MIFCSFNIRKFIFLNIEMNKTWSVSWCCSEKSFSAKCFLFYKFFWVSFGWLRFQKKGDNNIFYYFFSFSRWKINVKVRKSACFVSNLSHWLPTCFVTDVYDSTLRSTCNVSPKTSIHSTNRIWLINGQMVYQMLRWLLNSWREWKNYQLVHHQDTS